MIPRPIHRWKSFWLGVLVLAFLGWAWVRSMRHLDGVLWIAAPFAVSAAQTTGIVELAWDTSHPPGFEDFMWIHEPAMTMGEPRFPKAVNWETYDRQIQLTVAHWFLILLFLLPWAAFLLWRGRRMKSPAAGQPDPPA